MTAPLLAVTQISKKHCHQLRRSLRYAVNDIARELVASPSRTMRTGEFWAVRDVSFNLDPGEGLAIVGRNGAGKSTLMKLLAGLLKPDTGEIRIRGSSQAVLDLGGGLEPTLSGRENIELASALQGHDGCRRRRFIDEAIAFAELDEFIDDSVQSYSSGMKARLAYAIPANLGTDLLLVDEVLAVGDAAFQRKCIHHMQRYIQEGGSLVLISHSPYFIQPVCSRGLLLESGRPVFAGSAADALAEMRALRPGRHGPEQEVRGDTPVVIEGIRSELDPPGSGFFSGGSIRFVMQYELREPLDARWSFSIWTGDSLVCVTAAMTEQSRRLAAGRGELACVFPDLPLVPGRYYVCCCILDATSAMELARFGFEGEGFPLDVRSVNVPLGNLQAQLGQLVEVDVEWEEPRPS